MASADVELVVYRGVQFRVADLPKGVTKKDTKSMAAFLKEQSNVPEKEA